MLVSFIIPCYKSEATLPIVVEEISKLFKSQTKYQYQIILSCDGSPDGTFEEIRKLCEKDQSIIGINLSRNFGQQSARMAAIPHADGEYVVFMDDDGQHPVANVFLLFDKLDAGFDIAYAGFIKKKHNFVHILGSKLNSKIAEWLYGKPKNVHISSFFATKSFVVKEMQRYSSPNPYMLGYFLQITRNICTVQMEHKVRIAGKSGYTLSKLIKLWVQGFTSFSAVPLRFASIIGSIISLAGFVWGIYLIINKLINPLVAIGYTSTVAVILFIGGMTMLMLGLLGEYIARMFISINNLPQFIVRERINAEK